MTEYRGYGRVFDDWADTGPVNRRRFLSRPRAGDEPVSGPTFLERLTAQEKLVSQTDKDIGTARAVMYETADLAGLDIDNWLDSKEALLQRHLNPLQRARLQNAEQAEQTWRMTVEAGTLARTRLYEMQRRWDRVAEVHQVPTYDDDMPLGEPRGLSRWPGSEGSRGFQP
jgi:hypothetical protein